MPILGLVGLALKGGRKPGLGKISCPKTIRAYHVSASQNIPKILKDGFVPGSNPGRCRIGKGIYFFTRLARAKIYAKKVNGKVVECAVHTRRTIYDTGEQDFFKAEWVCGDTGIGIGRHWDAMDQGDKFYELVKKNPENVTILKVDGAKAELPPGKGRDRQRKIFPKSRYDPKKKMKLKCGAIIEYL